VFSSIEKGSYATELYVIVLCYTNTYPGRLPRFLPISPCVSGGDWVRPRQERKINNPEEPPRHHGHLDCVVVARLQVRLRRLFARAHAMFFLFRVACFYNVITRISVQIRNSCTRCGTSSYPEHSYDHTTFSPPPVDTPFETVRPLKTWSS